MKKMGAERLGAYATLAKGALTSATVEFALFLLMVSSLGVYTICEDLSLEKACRVNLNFTDAICDSIRNR